jgi:hypothetical protein
LNAPFERSSCCRDTDCGGEHQGVGGNDREDLVVGADGEVERRRESGQDVCLPLWSCHDGLRQRRAGTGHLAR